MQMHWLCPIQGVVVFGRGVLCDSHSAVVVHSLRRLRIYLILCDDLKQKTMAK